MVRMRAPEMPVRRAMSAATPCDTATTAPATVADADRFDRAFARAAGAALTRRNAVRLLLDAKENFPAWLAAIRAARHFVLFESYIIADDGLSTSWTKEPY